MSDTTGLSTAALSNAERVDIRRFCGYDMYGPGNAGFVGDRFFVAYGALEYRMTNAAPEELQVMRYHLSLLYPMEAAIATAYATLNVNVAAAFTRNADEVSERLRLYRYQRVQLCQFMGIPPGAGVTGAGSSTRALVI